MGLTETSFIILIYCEGYIFSSSLRLKFSYLLFHIILLFCSFHVFGHTLDSAVVCWTRVVYFKIKLKRIPNSKRLKRLVVFHSKLKVLLWNFVKYYYISGQACIAVSRLISWASVDRGWTENLAIPSWCYYPLYHRATVDRLHVKRVLNVPRDRAMHRFK